MRKPYVSIRLVVVLFLAVAGGARAALIDLSFSPGFQSVGVGSFVDVVLTADSDDGTLLAISAMDVILSYDPSYLSLQSVTNPGGQWLFSGFLPDLDGVNGSLTDGDAIYTALAQGSNLPTVPPSLAVTTIRFMTLAETAGTDVVMLPTIGQNGETRVFGAGVQNNITGDFSSVATIRIVPEPGSLLCVAVGAGCLLKRRCRSQLALR